MIILGCVPAQITFWRARIGAFDSDPQSLGDEAEHSESAGLFDIVMNLLQRSDICLTTERAVLFASVVANLARESYCC
jgi:hypothetical protein